MDNVDIKIDGPYTFCISINKKRFEYLCKNFKAVGLNEPKLYRGVRWNRGSNTGCVLGHVSVLNMARNMNMPYCVILEDDAYPRPDIIDTWNEIKQDLPEDWGILKIGSSSYRGERVYINKYIDVMRTGTAFGSHAYIVRHEVYDRLISKMLMLNVPDVAMNWEYYTDIVPKPCVLNFDYQLFIQKNISIDNIIANKGGQRYWFPHKEKGYGCTCGKPCEHFVDRLIPDEDSYVEQISVIYNSGWVKGKKSGVVNDDIVYTKDESGTREKIDDTTSLIKWKTGGVSKLRYDKEIEGIKFYTIVEDLKNEKPV